MKIKRKKQVSKNKKMAIIIIVLIIISLIIAAYYLSQRQIAIKKTASDQGTSSSSAVNIDKTAEGKPSNQITAPGNNSGSINITFSALGQDSAGGPLLIRTILDGATGGSCSITATKDTVVKNYSTNVDFSGTYYSCNYTIPFSDLSLGKWSVLVKVTDGTKTGELSNIVDIKN